MASAAGKGVIVAETLEQAEAAVTDMLSGNAFGEAGCRVVIEEFLEGEEASFIVMVDGETCCPWQQARTTSVSGKADTGPNTGGMGAYSPAPVVDEAVNQRIMDEVILPTVRGMAAEGNAYTGFLYAGLMISPDGSPKVIEYNCRFGDPETQPIMVRLQSDLVALCQQALAGELADAETSLGFTLCDRRGAGRRWLPRQLRQGPGHPGPRMPSSREHQGLHAGTALADGQVVTSGGRVLCVTALGDDIAAAQAACYEAADKISWDGVTLRRDIGWRAIARYS